MKIFESHAHLDFPQFDKDRDSVIRSAFKSGVEYIINVGVDDVTSKRSIELAGKYERIFASAGYHPHDAKKYDESIIRRLLDNPKVVALGEIGLDFYRNISPPDIQKKVFQKQIEIAIEIGLPIIVHNRNADEECFSILEKYDPKRVVFHCYSGDEILAEKILRKNWKISFAGTVTFPNSHLANVVRLVPEDGFFIETDSPYLSPQPRRGKRNDPANLRYIIEKIADIKRVSPRKIADFSYQNAIGFFRIKK